MKKFLLFAAAAMVVASASAETKNVIAEMYPGSAGLIGWGCDGLMEAVTEDGRDAMKFSQTAEGKNPWEVQFAFDYSYEVGKTYYFTFDVKGAPSEGIGSCFQCTDGWAACGDLNTFPIAEEWKTVTISGTVTDPGEGKSVDRWVASIGNYLGTFYISKMSLYTLTEGGNDTPVEPSGDWTSIINGGVAADGETSSIRAGWAGNAQPVDNPKGDGKVFECPIAENELNGDGKYDDWKSQCFIVFNEMLPEGTNVKISFDYYCTDERTITSQAQGAPGAYQHWNFIGQLPAKPEWQTLKWEGSISSEMAGEAGCGTLALNLASIAPAAIFYINNVVVEKAVPTGVQSVDAVVVPVTGVYNLQGVKVADSLDEVAAPGLYISNGKKIIKK